jgi:hypothetical protein
MRLVLLTAAALAISGCSQAPAPAPKSAGKPAAEVKILQFYASAGEVEQGTPITICYGVENARAVRIEPPVESLRPAISRCFSVTPDRGATYTLVAEGSDGKTTTATFRIKVKGRTAASSDLIQMFGSNSSQIQSGQPVTLCYTVEDATSLRIEPGVQTIKDLHSGCVLVRPNESTVYTLTANAADGRTDSRKLPIPFQ